MNRKMWKEQTLDSSRDKWMGHLDAAGSSWLVIKGSMMAQWLACLTVNQGHGFKFPPGQKVISRSLLCMHPLANKQ